jgi:ABC-type xylose transport system substrate-binding protein
MEDILVANPDVNLLIAENDAMAIGALKAINEAGKGSDITVAAFDGQKEAYELIKEAIVKKIEEESGIKNEKLPDFKKSIEEIAKKNNIKKKI